MSIKGLFSSQNDESESSQTTEGSRNEDRVVNHILGAMVDYGSESVEDAERLKELMKLTRNEREALLKGTLDELKGYSFGSEGSVNTREAWVNLVNVLEKHEPEIRKKGLAVVVVGSMQYDDPKHLDLDASFVTEGGGRKLEEARELVWRKWNPDVENIWPGGHNSAIINFEFIETAVAKIKGGDVDWTDNREEDICAQFGHLSEVLSGYPLVIPDERNFERLRKKSWKLALEEPFIGALVIMALQKCLEIRKARRN